MMENERWSEEEHERHREKEEMILCKTKVRKQTRGIGRKRK